MAEAIQEGGRLAVLVPTFRRPEGLIATLEGLRGQKGVSPFKVVVADNDQPAASGLEKALIWAHAIGWTDRVQLVPVDERGISACRNAGLVAAFANSAVDAVAMVDDDAVPDPKWLAAIAVVMSTHRPALIGGPTEYWFEGNVPTTVRNAEMFAVPFDRDGKVERLRSSNNCTITRSVYEQLHEAVFSTDFSFTGGEDTDLFIRCAEAGLIQFWTSSAVVREKVPPSRANEAWVLLRHRLSAANAARIDRRRHGITGAVVRQSALAAKELVGGLVRLTAGDPCRRFVGRLRFAGVAGRLDGLANIAQNLYRG